MDTVVFAALEEVCTRAASGLTLTSLWPKLTPSLASLSLPPLCSSVKSALWSSLLSTPGLLFQANGVSYQPNDPTIRSFDDCERIGLRIVAAEHLRDSFLGIYDIRASDAKVSEDGRRVMERLAVARSNGITQSELAKELGKQGNKIFYTLKKLETRGLIVRHSTILKTIDASSKRESTNSSIVNTNMLHLHRYAKHLGCQQRLEITREESANFDPVGGDSIAAECAKEDVSIKDFLPALKAICDKLEEAEGKVRVVADIKQNLGYKHKDGHRNWRNICNRLKEARVVEEFCANVKEKEVSCLRLLKSFSPKNFEPKTSRDRDDDLRMEQVVKLGKRGQITDQLLELPIEHQIYDMVDAEGAKGLTFTEICRRLGLNSKQYNDRLNSMMSRFGMHRAAENHNRGVGYRVWTPGNFHQEASAAAICMTENMLNEKGTSNPPAGDVHFQSAQSIQQSDVWTSEIDAGDSGKMPEKATEPELSRDYPTDELCTESVKDVTNVDPPESSSLVLSTPQSQRSYQRYPCLTLTAVSARREQWILKTLQERKFVISSELRRELDSLEKDKKTVTDRKTLYRALNKLQQEGHCKCISVSAPVVTNCSRSRTSEVILQASAVVTPLLLSQIHERLRSFEMEIRSQGYSKLKKEKPVPILDGVQRIFKNAKLDRQAENSEAMRSNGFVLAKMVRTKLLHIHLWGHLSSSPGWNDVISSAKHGYDSKNPHSTCKLFSLNAAIKAMPLELFLQVVGSAQKLDDMVEKCKSGVRLSDIPDEEYKRLMDTRAVARLSWIIDILRRLKLIRLVRDGQSEDNMTKGTHTTLTYAMEVKPYFEEPVSVIVSSSGVTTFDLRPQIRHDFVLSSREAVAAYWNTLEYSYAAADPRAALHAFPGSSVHEVFHFRSWTIIRVMTAEQRAELHKRVTMDDPNKKMSFRECEKVANDLNLTLQQVLRVYYDKRQSRLSRFVEVPDIEGDDIQPHKKRGLSSRKRKRSSEGRSSTIGALDGPLNSKKRVRSSDAEYQFTEGHNIPTRATTSLGVHDGLLENSRDEGIMDAIEETKSSKEREHHSLMHDCALSRMKSKRQKKFAWTEMAERKLIVEYVRHRAALGAKNNCVAWTSLSDLPATPDVCKRRMALLRTNSMFRKALMRLCNVLSQRYSKHLVKLQKKPSSDGDCGALVRDSVLVRNYDNNDELHLEDRWDSFEEEHVKLSLEEVLRCMSLAKLDIFKKRNGSVTAERSNPHIDAQEIDHLERGSNRKESHIHVSENNVTASNASSRRFSRKYTKLLNEGISVTRRAHEFLAVASAVELFKLVFLSTSTSLEVPNSLARTLKRYSEHDLFAAFNFLREKKIMIGGTAGSPFVLSQQFLHSISSSPFPVDTGKRAAKLASLITEKEKDLTEEGIDLTEDLQCGDILHVCALVFTGEISVSPRLPDEGVGEAEDTRIVKRKYKHKEVSSGNKAKKIKPSPAGEGDISSRREKGFPGLRLSLSRAMISRVDAMELFKGGDISNGIDFSNKGNTYPSTNTADTSISSDHMKEIFSQGSCTCKAVAGTEPEWERMSSYAKQVIALQSNQLVNPLRPELFKNIYSAIQKAGDQGLTMEEITQIMRVLGHDVPELVIGVLEAFGRTVKVNSYNTVHVVDSLYRSKYFLTSMATSSQHIEVALTKNSTTGNDSLKHQPKQHKDNNRQPEEHENFNLGVSKQLDNSGMHKITILNLPKEISPSPSNEVQCPEASEGCDQVKVTSQGSCHDSKTFESQPVDFERCRQILPWVNGDGTVNNAVYKGLVRRILGILMLNPGMLEDHIISRMTVLNPQSCRDLLKLMIMENYINVRKMHQSTCSGPPAILSGLVGSGFRKTKSVCREHFFANPMSTTLL